MPCRLFQRRTEAELPGLSSLEGTLDKLQQDQIRFSLQEAERGQPGSLLWQPESTLWRSCSRPCSPSKGFFGEENWASLHDAAGSVLAKRRETLLRVKYMHTLLEAELSEVAQHLERTVFEEGAEIIVAGVENDNIFFVESGDSVAVVPGGDWSQRYGAGSIFREEALRRNEPCAFSVIAATVVETLVLSIDHVHHIIRRRQRREQLLRRAKLLELLTDHQIGTLASLLEERHFTDGEALIQQGDEGHELFLLESGDCVATVATITNEQEVMRYARGDVFGELALLHDAPRGATVSACSDVKALVLSRASFERELGPLSLLQAQQFLADPRKLLVDFYGSGDDRGPNGTLERNQWIAESSKPSTWFAVYRPTSFDSIGKMLGKVGVGKGLNVKGKSAKMNRLSGYVPFIQISNNNHKSEIDDSPPRSRLRIFYGTEVARDSAEVALNAILYETPNTLIIDDPCIRHDDTYAPQSFGLDVPEALMREAYIMRPDLSPAVGWETGRESEPCFMDMNLAMLRKSSSPCVVVYQHDSTHPMNPLGLLVAYAEETVHPVVSDFDTLLVGSKGMEYAPLAQDQVQLVKWMLNNTQQVLAGDGKRDMSWTSRWLRILKKAALEGFHPEIPPYGFGDATSYKLIADAVAVTSPCGAVRHGAECFNFYFPQELDQEYLVVWEGLHEQDWAYLSEPSLREFLLERANEGFTFPLNPVWPVRDQGWFEVFQALRRSISAQPSLACWYPEDIIEMIEDIHRRYPEGFVQNDHAAEKRFSAVAAFTDMSALDFASFAEAQIQLTIKRRWQRIRRGIIQMAFGHLGTQEPAEDVPSLALS